MSVKLTDETDIIEINLLIEEQIRPDLEDLNHTTPAYISDRSLRLPEHFHLRTNCNNIGPGCCTYSLTRGSLAIARNT